MSSFNASTPFILIARVTIKPENISAYLELAKKTDDAVNASEPGMLHHTFDQDPENECVFTWSEVYENDAAMLKHLSNPPVGEYLEKHAELAEDKEGVRNFVVEVYGTIGEELRKALEGTGLPLKVFESKLGYSRCGGGSGAALLAGA
jgi:quinol monooxygenase YgiN